jgi:hypothetical protein
LSETGLCESVGLLAARLKLIPYLLELDGRYVSQGLKRAALIEPVDPVQGRQLDVRQLVIDDWGIAALDDTARRDLLEVLDDKINLTGGSRRKEMTDSWKPTRAVASLRSGAGDRHGRSERST